MNTSFLANHWWVLTAWMVPGPWLEACQWYSFFMFFSSHHCPLTLDRPSPACSLLPRERMASKWTNPADHRKSQPQSVRRCLNIGGWCCFGLSKMFNSFVIALLLAMNGYVICIHIYDCIYIWYDMIWYDITYAYIYIMYIYMYVYVIW